MIVVFHLYVYAQRISQKNEYTNKFESWNNLKCGRCYTINRKIKSALSGYCDLMEWPEIRMMYWPHHDCIPIATKDLDINMTEFFFFQIAEI